MWFNLNLIIEYFASFELEKNFKNRVLARNENALCLQAYSLRSRSDSKTIATILTLLQKSKLSVLYNLKNSYAIGCQVFYAK